MKQAEAALIVGAGSGLSASLARLFAKDGMRVALAARDTSKLASLVKETSALPIACDAADPAQVEAMFAAVEAKWGVPDLVVYNAGYRVRGPFVGLDPKEVERTISVTGYAGFLVDQSAAKRMLPRRSGAVFFTAASATVTGYAASARIRRRSLQSVRQGFSARLRRASHHRSVRGPSERRARAAQGASRAERISARGGGRQLRRHARRLWLHFAPARERAELHHGGAQGEFPRYGAGRRAVRRGARRAPGTHHAGLGRDRDPRRRAAQARAFPLHPARHLSEVERGALAHHTASSRGVRRSRRSAVTSLDSKAIAVAAMMRSAGSPGAASSNEPASWAIPALTGSKCSSGSVRRSASHCSPAMPSTRRPLRTAVAISNRLIAEAVTGPSRNAAPMARFARTESLAVSATHQTSAWVSSTITCSRSTRLGRSPDRAAARSAARCRAGVPAPPPLRPS